jgi:hypothetical protein
MTFSRITLNKMTFVRMIVRKMTFSGVTFRQEDSQRKGETHLMNDTKHFAFS